MFSANTSQVSADQLYVEDVFSTYLYTGNGSSQTITNGIDLAGKGGLVWTKRRVNTGGIGNTSHILTDTVRGANKQLYSNGTDAQATNSNMITSFNANGYSIGSDGNVNFSNASPQTYVSWTFREAPKFFDVVTYTGDGTVGRNISHNLGVAPGCMIIKCTNTTTNWAVYHRSTGNAQAMNLNSTNASGGAAYWASTSPTATQFTLGAQTDVNGAGNTYVAYLFAHDTTSDGIIQCGSFTTGGSPVSVNLGWEPQWLLFKQTSTADDWQISDNMRGLPASSANVVLRPNTDGPEGTNGNFININSTGFVANNAVYSIGTSFIYIAIRRGPMRTPTSGTSVFSVKNYLATTSSASVTHDVTFDAEVSANRDGVTSKFLFVDGLRGINGNVLVSSNTNAEASYPTYWSRKDQRTMSAVSAYDEWWAAGSGTRNHISYGLVRAPSFFDVVCYTGNDVAGRTINHNLSVTPEMIIVKGRIDGSWWVQHSSLGPTKYLVFNTSDASGTASSLWNNTAPTSSVFTIGNLSTINFPGYTYVAYLFASAPGVSKVGSYTGNGSSQTINCGFAAGARFVMIKRTDSTGSWWVWDVARGLVSGNDPALQLNSTAAETTGIDSIDPDSSGFIVNQDTTTNINVSSGTYVYLAIS